MAGLFDDLVPRKAAPAQRSGLFADLIPRGPDFSEADPADENPDVTARAAQAANPMNGRGSAVDSAIKGATLGFGDEAAGVIGGALGWLGIGPESTFEGGYNRTVNNIRNRTKDYEARHPVAATVAEIAGSLPTLALPGGAAMKAASLPLKAAGSAAAGALTGAAQGFGEGEGGVSNRLNAAGHGLAAGGLLGAAVPIAGRGIAKVIGSRAGMKAVPAVEDLKKQAQDLYDHSEAQGVFFEPQRWSRLVDAIGLRAKAAGLDKSIHPRATAALDRLIESKGTIPTLKNVDTLRQVVRSAAASTEPAERYQAGKMLGLIDNYVSNLGPAGIISGNRQEAITALQTARKLWSSKAKGDVLADMYDRAQTRSGQYSGSGFENALRTEFRQLALNKKRLRQFSASEQADIKKIARGGSLQNLLRGLGKAAPTGIVSAGLGGGAGFAAGGIPGAVAVMAGGALARKAATKIGERSVERLSAKVRNGGVAPFDQAAALEAERKANLLLGTGGRAAIPVFTGPRPASAFTK